MYSVIIVDYKSMSKTIDYIEKFREQSINNELIVDENIATRGSLGTNCIISPRSNQSVFQYLLIQCFQQLYRIKLPQIRIIVGCVCVYVCVVLEFHL